LEYSTFQRLPLLVRRAEAMIVAAVNKILGPVYKSSGDDPAQMGGAEAERPCWALPRCALDQLIVSERGAEPDITSSLEGMGWLRANGMSAFSRQVDECMGGLSTDKVYTFGLWSVSRIFDVLNWTLGLPAGPRLDFGRLGAAPPCFLGFYELSAPQDSTQRDARHLISRKRYYIRTAFWSTSAPPEPAHLRTALQSKADEKPASIAIKSKSAQKLGRFWAWASDLMCCCSSRV